MRSSEAATSAPVSDPSTTLAGDTTLVTTEPTGIPGLDDPDAFCAAWAVYSGTLQAIGVAQAFGNLTTAEVARLEVIAAARQLWPNCVAMVSTIFGDEEHVLRAIQVGAMGYLLKDVPAPQVVEEIRLLAAGGSPISPMVARKLLVMRLNADSATPAAPPEDRGDMHADTGLSTREIEVLRLVARGHTLEEVARALSLSRHTVRTFVRRLYAKLQVSTRAQAVREALRQGLL